MKLVFESATEQKFINRDELCRERKEGLDRDRVCLIREILIRTHD